MSYFMFALSHLNNGFTLKSYACSKFLDKDLKFTVDNGFDECAKFELCSIRPDGGVMIRAKQNRKLVSDVPLYFKLID